MEMDRSLIRKVDDGMTHPCLIFGGWLIISKKMNKYFIVADPLPSTVMTEISVERGRVICEGGIQSRKAFKKFSGKVVVV